MANSNKYDIEFLKLEGDYSYFDAYGLPTTIVFDKSGIEIFRTSGIKKNQFTSKIFIQKIKKLLGKNQITITKFIGIMLTKIFHQRILAGLNLIRSYL